MFGRIARAIFGTANDRSIKAFQRRVPAINALEPAMQALTDEALQGKTAEFRRRLAAGEALDSHHVELATELIVRGTTAPPPATA